MKRGHRLSCKHLDVILARAILAVLSQCLMCVCVCAVGRGGCEPPTGDEPRPSRQQLRRTDSVESLQLFLRGRRGELLIECECKLQRLLIWPWLERRTTGAGGVGGHSLNHPHHHIPTHLTPPPPSRFQPTHHTPLITSHGKARKTTTFYNTQQQQDIVTCKDQAVTSAEPEIKLGSTDKKKKCRERKKRRLSCILA